MAIKDEIIKLYKGLGEAERKELLEELGSREFEESISISDAAVIKCPHCESKLFVKNGKRGKLQKYKCKTCCKIFTSKTGTAYHKIQKLEKFELYKTLMMEEYYPLEVMAEKIGISYQTAFDWRHKILSTKISEKEDFEDITEIDDIWFVYSQKGRKGLDYSKKRGGSRRAGDNGFQAKLLITSDRKSKKDISLVRIGRIRKSDIQRKISGKLGKGCTLVSDKHRSISSFAKSEGVKHVSFKASEHSAGGEYHVQNVNNMASKIKDMVNHRLRGVSTKYLQSYANWFKLKLSKDKGVDIDVEISSNRNVSKIHRSREKIYKRFIENFSQRTYRCPTKRQFITEPSLETLINLGIT